MATFADRSQDLGVQSPQLSLPPPDLSNCKKSDIRSYFLNSYDIYEALFSSIQDDSTFYKQPDKLRLQLIFYLGHTSAVYVNKLVLSGSLQDRLQSPMDAIFETGVDEMVWDSTDHCRLGGDFNWPRVQEVWQYRSDVKRVILDLIDAEAFDLPLLHKDPWWALVLGIEHERIHLETSSVLLRELPVELLKAPSGWHYAPASTVAASTKTTGNEDENGSGKNEFIAVRAQSVSIGKPDDFPSFGWDNEYGHLNVKVPDFEAQQYLTSNQDFLAFVDADGYNCRQYWSEEGWKWCCARKATHPTFWVCTDGCQAGCDGDLNEHSHCTKTGGGQDGAFRYRAMFDVIDMPWSWPAETNYHEARAYCKWLGDNCRIITEAEFLAIQDRQSVPEDGVGHDVIFQPDATEKFNLNMSFCSSTPVDYYKKNSAGFSDTMGNVWQWTEDHFNGLPGAKFDYLYHDFSTPYYDGWHNLILGGSWISTGDSASSFARFWFRRHFFQHMGFRVVRSTNPPPVQLLSTQVYQPGAGFLDTELQVSNFSPEQRVKSFTPEFDLESSDMIKAQLHWDFAPKVKTTKTQKSLLEPMDKFDQDDIRSVVIRSPTKTSSSSTAGFWGELSSTVGTATKLVKSCEGRALVIGSGTGRMAMEVAKHHNNVLAIHPVARAIEISEMLQQGIIPKGPAVDGISLDGLVLPETKKKLKDVTFKQFLWVPLEMGKFDLVVLALLDIATCPEYWISRLADIVAKSGVAMVVSSTWNVARLSPILNKHRLSLDSSCQLVHDQPSLHLPVSTEKTTLSVSTWRHAST